MSRLQEARELLAATEGHTPGPWALAQYGPCLWDVVPDDGPGRIARRVCQDTNNLGDAFIIAAAPALRELLAAMVAEVEALDELAVEFDGGEITELNQAWPTWQRAMARYRAAHPCSGAYCTDRNCAGDQEELS